MQDANPEEEESKESTEQLKAERQSDATDDEVLEAESGAGSDKGTPRDEALSPDGAFDEKEETDKAGPM